MVAVRHGDIVRIRRLVDMGTNVNFSMVGPHPLWTVTSHKASLSPLHVAVTQSKNCLQSLQCLVAAKADPNAKNSVGSSGAGL